MTKSTFAIIIMGIIMVAMLAFGGTFAYFTATTASQSMDVTTGKVVLTSNLAGDGSVTFYSEDEAIVPGQPLVDGVVTFTNASTVDTYVAVKFTLTATRDGKAVEEATLTALKEAIGLELNANWVQGSTNKDVYVLKGSASSLRVTKEQHTSGVNFTENAITFVADNNYHEGSYDADNSTTKTDLENINLKIAITAYSVQADYAETAKETPLSVNGITSADADSVWSAIKHMHGIQ